MNEQEFKSMWDESLARLDKYVEAATAVSEDCKRDAEHHKRSMIINEGHFRYVTLTEGKDVYLCNCCGKMETANFCEQTRSRMIATKSCFHCQHWDEKAENHLEKPYIVVKGRVYYDGGRTPESNVRYNGFGGQEFKIAMSDGRVTETNNLWSIGIVPHTHIHLFPNNAEFVKG